MFHVVPSLRAAEKSLAAGVDGLVVEGGEGGGFKATRDVATMVLLPLVCAAVDVPVIGAGGICDGRSMAAAFVLGAEGVQLGTRMVSAAESPVHDNYKQLVVDAAETGTVFLNRWHKPGFRVLATPRSEAHERNDEQVALGTLDGILRLYFEGDLEAAFAFGGQVAGRIDEVRPVADILHEMVRDMPRRARRARGAVPLDCRLYDEDGRPGRGIDPRQPGATGRGPAHPPRRGALLRRPESRPLRARRVRPLDDRARARHRQSTPATRKGCPVSSRSRRTRRSASSRSRDS